MSVDSMQSLKEKNQLNKSKAVKSKYRNQKRGRTRLIEERNGGNRGATNMYEKNERGMMKMVDD